MSKQYCSPAQLSLNRSRLLLRLYRRYLKVGESEALNCCDASQAHVDGDIGEHLRYLMNQWKSFGFDVSSGRVNYQQLSSSQVFEEFRQAVPLLREYDLNQLNTYHQRLAFWINIYNVLTIHGIISYQITKSIEDIRGQFERIAYIINGLRFSLNDIENGILRANQTHVAFPISRFPRRDKRRKFVVYPLEPRVHFALVCASNSCPPIGIYQAENLDQQLDIATKSFISSGGVVLNKEKMSVSLSQIFQWYSNDFGGGWMGFGNQVPVLTFISQYMVNQDDSQFVIAHAKDLKIEYQSYDWSLNA